MDGGLWHCTGGRDQNHPQAKAMQKGKMAVWRGLTNSYKKKRSQRQWRKGKIYPFEREFQRITRRNKKAFSSHQCKEIEENNRMGKTTDLFEKIWDRKGIFHAKMGTINNRNGMDQQKQKILRRSGKNTQKNYTKKISMTQIITMVWWLTKSQTSWNVKSTSLRKHY